MFSRLRSSPSFKLQVFTILWLSFLIAGVATGVFFSIVDPVEMSSCVRLPEVSRTAAYSIGFLLFWLLSFVTSMLSILFLGVNQAEV